jgi:hypothetical protein
MLPLGRMAMGRVMSEHQLRLHSRGMKIARGSVAARR